MEHALLRGDIGMRHDPLRAQSLSFAAGCVLTVVIVGVCVVLAFLRPAGTVSGAAIVMSRDSGALYVHMDGTLHPVPNLASARLITGSSARPALVDAAQIAKATRGPLLGIPGAPATIAPPLTETESAWTLCDGATTTLIAGDPGPLDEARQPSILVTPHDVSAATTYLVYDGQRAQVDLRDPAVVWALRLDGVAPRPVSWALLDAVPEAPAITPPLLAEAGRPGAVAGLRVGTVVRVTSVDADDYFVVLTDGMQRIGEVTANLIRITASHGSRDIVSVSPDALRAVPVVHSLPVSTFPERAGVTIGAADGGTLCAQWRPQGPEVVVRLRDALPVEFTPATLAQADGDGANIDSIMMPPGRSAYVRSTALDGAGGDAAPLYFVTDSGVVFGIPDRDTAKVLGIEAEPVAAPWPMLARLPRGPELSRESASVPRDSIAPSP